MFVMSSGPSPSVLRGERKILAGAKALTWEKNVEMVLIPKAAQRSWNPVPRIGIWPKGVYSLQVRFRI